MAADTRELSHIGEHSKTPQRISPKMENPPPWAYCGHNAAQAPYCCFYRLLHIAFALPSCAKHKVVDDMQKVVELIEPTETLGGDLTLQASDRVKAGEVRDYLVNLVNHREMIDPLGSNPHAHLGLWLSPVHP
jgi:hypothetical protein